MNVSSDLICYLGITKDLVRWFIIESLEIVKAVDSRTNYRPI